MDTSAANYYPSTVNQSSSGLTLIEVLVALAIIAIALTAIIKAASQNIRSTNYLQDKTIAMWVGQEVLNEARLGLLKLPESPGVLKKSNTTLDQTWYWQASQKETPNKRIKRIVVRVFASEEDEQSALIELESFQYAK